MSNVKSSEQIQNEIKNLQQKLHEANIREGKVDIVAEVKKRILEVAPNIANIEYVLWPLRIYVWGSDGEKHRRSYLHYDDPEVQKMLEAKDYDGIVAKYGVSRASINNYLYRKRKEKGCTISV